FKEGWVEAELNRARYKLADQMESGELPIVGMNLFRDEETAADIEIFRQAPDMQAKRIEYVQNYKKNGNRDTARKALKNLYERTRSHAGEDLVAPMLEAVEARATLQEVCDAMREAVGFSMPE
ncbi:MAG TPA: methylmalonyl-CoA mutase family protein, partial [Syntrophorhabdales bacterium]|nr:methylmalonyl-CoA mutase family protein [Syntrophorhabdales bacterium]